MIKIRDPTAKSLKIKPSTSIIALHNISVQDKITNQNILILALKPLLIFVFALVMNFKNHFLSKFNKIYIAKMPLNKHLM